MLKPLILTSRENDSDGNGNEINVDSNGDEGKTMRYNDKVEGEYEDCIKLHIVGVRITQKTKKDAKQRRNNSTKCEKEEVIDKNIRHSRIPHQSKHFCNYVNKFMFVESKAVSFLNSKSPRDLKLKYNYMLFVAELYHSRKFH